MIQVTEAESDSSASFGHNQTIITIDQAPSENLHKISIYGTS